MSRYVTHPMTTDPRASGFKAEPDAAIAKLRWGRAVTRVTPADIEAEIASEHYFTAADGVIGESGHDFDARHVADPLKLLTFCVLILRNGFTVTGESACASPENFDAEINRRIARENAVQKIWPLMGFKAEPDAADS